MSAGNYTCARWSARLALVTAVALLLLASLVPTVGAANVAPVEDAPARLGTPVLSARRAPQLLARTVADTRLGARLDAAVAEPHLGAARQSTCLVIEEQGRRVYARGAGLALIPASTMKILTGMAALTRLGPDYRYVTEVRAAQAPRGGVIEGAVWLVGSGDPLLATAPYAASFQNQPQIFTPLERLADSIVAAGVEEIRGPIVGDEGRYDTERYVPTWKPGYIADNEIGPASALIVNDGFVTFSPLRRIATSDPARHAATVLTELLGERGVTVHEGAQRGAVPSGTAVIGSVLSPPMTEVVAEMVRESDNLTAELLVKELGRRFASAGTWGDGLSVVRDTLSARGLPVDAIVAHDGSGLSRSNRLSCDVLMDAMEAVGPDGPLARSFPVAGETGTLARRFVGNPAAGRLRAKTGSLDGVAGLSGYVETERGHRVAFSLIANELPRDRFGRELQEEVGAILVAYPEAPPPEELGPLPSTTGDH